MLLFVFFCILPLSIYVSTYLILMFLIYFVKLCNVGFSFSSVKITRPTQIQLEKLVDFLEKNPGLARGNMRSVQARRQTKIKWEQVAISLNSLGGAIKDARSWTKVSRLL